MRKNEVITPAVADGVVSRAIHDGKIHVERVGKIIDKYGNSIAEKMIIFWGEHVITIFRTKCTWIEDFPVIVYNAEKYPCNQSDAIIAEIQQMRLEWTSGVI